MICDIWYMIYYIWYMINDTWYMIQYNTYYILYMTCDIYIYTHREIERERAREIQASDICFFLYNTLYVIESYTCECDVGHTNIYIYMIYMIYLFHSIRRITVWQPKYAQINLAPFSSSAGAGQPFCNTTPAMAQWQQARAARAAEDNDYYKS